MTDLKNEAKDEKPVEINPTTGKPRRKHTAETKALMSERRRARTTQPRDGQSKKRKNLYEELKHEYKNCRDQKKKAEVLKWIEANRRKLDTTAKETAELGIVTEYHEMYNVVYEKKVGSILFDNDDLRHSEDNLDDPWNTVQNLDGDELVDTCGLDD